MTRPLRSAALSAAPLARVRRRGASHIEYGLILLVGCVAGIAGMDAMGEHVGSHWNDTSATVVVTVADAHARGSVPD